MKHHYSDIRDRIDETPKWWDEEGVPRYCDFGPRESADIYARQVVLLEIACQDCEQRFLVCMSSDVLSNYTLERLVEVNELHYGDPPNAGCCPAGPTMNSIPVRVVEFWDSSDRATDWTRRPELEVEIDCEWAA